VRCYLLFFARGIHLEPVVAGKVTDEIETYITLIF
jgi:hypothetical protein